MWPRLGEADIRGLRLGLDMVLNEWTRSKAYFFSWNFQKKTSCINYLLIVVLIQNQYAKSKALLDKKISNSLALSGEGNMGTIECVGTTILGTLMLDAR